MISVIHINLTSQSQADHSVVVSMNNVELKTINMLANESQTHTIEYGIEYKTAQYKSLLFNWQGTECAKKFLHIESITLDSKPVNMDNFMSVPNKTDYNNVRAADLKFCCELPWGPWSRPMPDTVPYWTQNLY